MIHLLLAVIYLSFISLGLPDSLLGAAWPKMYLEFGVPVSFAGIISMIISMGTIISSLQSDRLTKKLGTGKVTAISEGSATITVKANDGSKVEATCQITVEADIDHSKEYVDLGLPSGKLWAISKSI